MAYQSELYRLQGAALSRLKRAEEAEAAFENALREARARETKAQELRAAASLADFLQERGRRSEGNEILSPVVEWFVEGFETGDLKQAKALLDQLA